MRDISAHLSVILWSMFVIQLTRTMDTKCSSRDDHCEKSTPANLVMLNVKDGDAFKIWSLASVSGDQYIIKTEFPVIGDPANVYKVQGNGAADEAQSTEIVFKSVGTPRIDKKEYFYMQFKTDNGNGVDIYTIDATEVAVQAVKNAKDLSSLSKWHPVGLPPPINVGYIVFNSSKTTQSGEALYLSCSGNGELKLKRSKHKPTNNFAVDVSLLFKVVDPLK